MNGLQQWKETVTVADYCGSDKEHSGERSEGLCKEGSKSVWCERAKHERIEREKTAFLFDSEKGVLYPGTQNQVVSESEESVKEVKQMIWNQLMDRVVEERTENV